MVKNSRKLGSKSEDTAVLPVEDTPNDSSEEGPKTSKREEQNQENEDIKENGDTAVEKKKKPVAKKAKAAVKKPAGEPERKSSRQPKPVLKEEDQNQAEKTKPKKEQKRSTSKSPSRSKKSKSSKEEKDYEVEDVVDMRIKKGKKEFKIRWKGYKPSQDTWEPEKHLSCQDLIEKYLESHSEPVAEEKPKASPKRSKTPVSKSAKRTKTK